MPGFQPDDAYGTDTLATDGVPNRKVDAWTITPRGQPVCAPQVCRLLHGGLSALHRAV